MDHSSPRLYLCAGLQRSGSTLVSWCFLQRHDMDGVLDGEYDLLPRIELSLGKPLAWCKTTVSCFRLSELVRHYEDEGWPTESREPVARSRPTGEKDQLRKDSPAE